MPSPGRERDHGSSRVARGSRTMKRERDRTRSRTRSPRTDRRSRDLSRVYTVFVKHLPEDVKYVVFSFALPVDLNSSN